MIRVALTAGVLLVSLSSCDDASRTSSSPTAEATAPSAADPAAPNPAPAAEPTPAPEPGVVDLLHAVPTTVSASAAHGDDVAQVERLFDGDLETAWNSKTDEMVGSFVDISLPETSVVSAIEMTAGYTKRSDTRDLFTGNHRIRAVRIHRPLAGGVEATDHELDIESRELQRIEVSGGGGVWRIEVRHLEPGTQERWREACISEIRVMGTEPAARPNTQTPTARIGSLSGGGDETGASLDQVAEAFISAQEAQDEETPRSEIARALQRYRAAWVERLLSLCDMPRLSDAYGRVGPVHEQMIGEMTRVERQLSRAQSRLDDEESDRNRERFERAEERHADYDARLNTTQESVSEIVASMQEHMCDEARDELEQFPDPSG